MKRIKNIINLIDQFLKNILFIFLSAKKFNFSIFFIIKYIILYVYNFINNILIINNKFKKDKKDFISFTKKLKFTNDWFTNNIPVWISAFKKNVKNQKIKILEIGSYEGMSAIFFLKYFDSSKIDCVETFEGSKEHSSVNFNKIKNNFQDNMSDFGNRYNLHEMTSDIFFFKTKDTNETYDIIYIDGSHESEQVLKDAENSFKKLNKNGLIIFDDFLRKYYTDKKLNPFSAILKFIQMHKKEIKVIYVGYQLILKKET